MDFTLQPDDVLLIIDLQNDFCPPVNGAGGALAVSDGDAIIPTVNALAARFPHVILTQDWHPARHISFATTHNKDPYETIEVQYGLEKITQTLWPDHCLQDSTGADFHAALEVPQTELILRKGFRPHIDSYSAFLENDHLTPTGLAGYLRERELNRLFLCGLAYDFCVRHSAVDGKHLGFNISVIEDATRAVNLPGSVAETNATLATHNIRRIQSTQLLL
jgi:nicotinamidase/pyrazinamidase